MSWRWLLENPQILFVLGGAVAYWLNERRKAKEPKPEMDEPRPREPADDEMAERTRRIQEEIRRKIEERQGLAPRSAPVSRETARPAAPPPLPEPRPVVVSVEEAPGAAELERVMEEQRRYAEQIERLAAAERTAKAYSTPAATAVIAAYTTSAVPGAVLPSRRGGAALAGLHDREALRRAIVLREVLGAPKALQ